MMSFSFYIVLIFLLFIFQAHFSFSQAEYGQKTPWVEKQIEQAREKPAMEQEESAYGTVYLMKPNSTGHIYVEHTAFPDYNGIMQVNTTVITGNLHITHPATIDEIMLSANTSSVLLNKTATLYYALSTFNHTKGVYWFPITDCQIATVIVGLDISQVNPSFLYKLVKQNLDCASFISEKWIELSGLISEDITTQMKPVKEVTLGWHQGITECNGFVLLLRNDNHMPV